MSQGCASLTCWNWPRFSSCRPSRCPRTSSRLPPMSPVPASVTAYLLPLNDSEATCVRGDRAMVTGKRKIQKPQGVPGPDAMSQQCETRQAAFTGCSTDRSQGGHDTATLSAEGSMQTYATPEYKRWPARVYACIHKSAHAHTRTLMHALACPRADIPWRCRSIA